MLSVGTDWSVNSHIGMTGSRTSVKFVNSHWSVQIKLFCLRPLCQICFAAVNKLFVRCRLVVIDICLEEVLVLQVSQCTILTVIESKRTTYFTCNCIGK